ncbi:contact-dependent growth inhibition system immunity protein [Erwinia sp. AnSW2-5]|uniref:contact-dependent growth inhibition system immunity protein n=1 Tax=Erwinia sp. AnSW2-5 TaxID=3367692 RepID=UPI00385A2637
MNNKVKAQWAGAKTNKDFICIDTWSGYGAIFRDPKGVQHLTSHNVSDSDLGAMLLDALAHSRFVLPKPSKSVWHHPEVTYDYEVHDYDRMNENYNQWISDLMLSQGYKTKRTLFKGMKSCGIECSQGVITIRPSFHEKAEAWSGRGIEKSDYVVLAANSPEADIGAALRLAFSRCKGSK